MIDSILMTKNSEENESLPEKTVGFYLKGINIKIR
jgi:hypothetical protein